MTAELAIGLVAVAAVLVVLLGVGAATATRLRCLDAARTGARAAALGQADGQVVAVARRSAGAAASVTVEHTRDGWVQVTVSAPVLARGPASGLRASAVASTVVEP